MVLKDLAELDQRRADSKSDSVAISNLTKAFYAKSDQLKLTEEALKLSNGIGKVKDEQIAGQAKEIRKQKIVKWLAIIGGVVGVILSQ